MTQPELLGQPDKSTSLLALHRQLLARAVPFIDLRAPTEFARGAVPQAVNLPLLTDAEREEIGRCYKAAGHTAAVTLGEKLVAGTTRESRIDGWEAFARDHPDAWLYCWRGGLRSEVTQTWLRQRGIDLPRVPGGFKALRQTCLDVLDDAPRSRSWLVVGGRTGSGKTRLLARSRFSLDLEGIARHRGSAFGALEVPQPQPVDFENTLAVALIRHNDKLLVVEDESRTIGRLALPAPWHAAMQSAPLLILQASLEERCGNIRREYVDEPLAAGTSEASLSKRFEDALARIQRRLGGARYEVVLDTLRAGFRSGEHEAWIELLLTWYYDPMYDYQLEQKADRVIARGGESELLEFIGEKGW
jgi:tRNA 2-selenouridine synthase